MSDSLIEVIISSFPDMETLELAELEIAVNAELQDRYRNGEVTVVQLASSGEGFDGL